jgi:hypothetical protein
VEGNVHDDEEDGPVRAFHDEQDADFLRMRMIAIWEAEETMQRGVSERHYPSTFLA